MFSGYKLLLDSFCRICRLLLFFCLLFFLLTHTSAGLFWRQEFLAAFVPDSTGLLMFFFPVVVTLMWASCWVKIFCVVLCMELCTLTHGPGVCDTAGTQTLAVTEVKEICIEQCDIKAKWSFMWALTQVCTSLDWKKQNIVATRICADSCGTISCFTVGGVCRFISDVVKLNLSETTVRFQTKIYTMASSSAYWLTLSMNTNFKSKINHSS